MNKKDALEKAFELGVDYEIRATNCCQSTIAAIQDTIGFKNDDIFRAGSLLTGGRCFGTMGTCGALIGGAMVLGQLYGRPRTQFDIDSRREIDNPTQTPYFNPEVAKKGWELAYELFELFLINYGGCICFEVSDKVIGRSKVEPFIRNDSPARVLISSKIRRISSHSKEGCGSVVGNAAKWTTEIILREGIPDYI